MTQPDGIRAGALKALETLGDPRRADAARRAAALPGSQARAEALRILANTDPAAAIPLVLERVERGTHEPTARGPSPPWPRCAATRPARRSSACSTSSGLASSPPSCSSTCSRPPASGPSPRSATSCAPTRTPGPRATRWPDTASCWPAATPAAAARSSPSKAAVECLRCHKARARNGEIAGGEVGPDLTGVGAEHDRAYILESILDPNKQIAQGFESVILATEDGRVITGVFRGEDAKAIHLMTAEGKAAGRAQGLDRRPQARPLRHAR